MHLRQNELFTVWSVYPHTQFTHTSKFVLLSMVSYPKIKTDCVRHHHISCFFYLQKADSGRKKQLVLPVCPVPSLLQKHLVPRKPAFSTLHERKISAHYQCSAKNSPNSLSSAHIQAHAHAGTHKDSHSHFYINATLRAHRRSRTSHLIG